MRGACALGARMDTEELRAIRGKLGWTQLDLAQALGVRESTVARWEQGAARVTEPMARLVRLVAKHHKPRRVA